MDLDVEQAKLPAYSLAHLETLYNTTEQAVEENEKKLVTFSETEIPSLKAALKELQSQIEFSKVVLSSEQTAGDKLMLIEGWAPAFSQVEIEAYLNDAHVYYEITDPMPGDNVPIRLNNKGFFAWFEPICKLYMLPKYNELDLDSVLCPVLYGLFRTLSGRFRIWGVPVSGSYGLSVDGEESDSVNEVDHFIDTGIGCFNILLRFADRYVLRSEYLRFELADCSTSETCRLDG